MPSQRHLFAVLFFAFLVCSALSPLQAHAQSCTHYVNATDGDDGNAGSLTAPVRSIEYAFTTFPDGSIICVAAGEYFYGLDEDGIQLVAAGKSVEFRLESFAGASEVRFSEKEFVLDVESGSVVVAAGSSSEWVLGAGIVNNDNPDRPDLLNFLHTFTIASGTLELQNLSPTLEASVGNPDFQHPVNTDKVAPESASIRWGNGNVTSNVTFENGPRTVVFEGSDATERMHQIPSGAGQVELVFAQANPIVIPSSLELGQGSLVFTSSGSTTFESRVSIEAADGSISTSESWSGSLAFDDVLEVQGSDDAVFIDHSGTGSIEISRLELGAQTLSRGTILNRGGGQLTVVDATTDADPNASTGHFLDLQNLSGTTLLGADSAPIAIAGRISNAASMTFSGVTTVTDVPGGAPLVNTGTISSASGLVLAGNGASIVSDGVFLPGSIVTIEAGATVSGSGTWPVTSVENSTLDISGSPSFERLSISESVFSIQQSSHLQVSELTSLSGTSVLTVAADGVLDTETLTVVGEEPIITLGDGARLLIGDALRAADASTLFSTSAGRISNGDDDGFTIEVSPDASVAPVVAMAGSVSVSGGARWHLLHADGASIRAVFGSSTTASGIISEDQGEIVIQASQTLTLEGSTRVDGTSRIVFESNEPIHLNGTFESLGGTIDLQTTPLRLTGASVLRAPADSPIVLPSLLLDDENGFLTLQGAVVIESGLSLSEAGVFLDNGSRMILKGDLSRLSGSFALESEGVLLFSGSASQTVSGFTGSVLPGIISEGLDVTMDGSVTLLGSIRLVSGALSLTDGSTLTIPQDLDIVGGTLQTIGNASIRVTGDTNMSAGRYMGGSGSTTVNGNIIFAGGDLDAGSGTWILDPAGTDESSAAESVILVDADLTLYQVSLMPAALVRIEGSATLTVEQQLSVATDSRLVLGNNSIRVRPGSIDPTVQNDGSIEATSGQLILESGDTSKAPSLSGSGLFHNVAIDLANDDLEVMMVAGTPVLRVSGELSFVTGALDLNGTSLVFDTEASSAPGLHMNLSDSAPENGAVDGKGITDSTGPIAFNESGIPFNLRFSGNATTLFDPPAFIASSTIKDLTISTRDPVNAPPLFGLSVSTPMQASGSFEMAVGSVLRLQQPLRLVGDQQRHRILGRVSGSGALIIAGMQNEFRAEGDGSFVNQLALEGTDSFTSTSLWLDTVVGSLTSTGGRYLINGPTSATTPAFVVQRDISLTNSDWTLNTGLSLGMSGASNQLAVQSSTVRLGSSGFWMLPLGGSMTIDDSSSLETVDAGAPDAVLYRSGAFVLGGTTRMNVSSSMPRLAIDIQDGSDDVFLESNLTVSESLILVNGDLRLGGYTLRLLSGSHFLDADEASSNGSSDAILGDISQDPGTIVFSGSQTIGLGGNVAIQDALVDMDAGNGGLVSLQSLNSDGQTLNLSGGRLNLASGELDLGSNDLAISSSAIGMVQANGGVVSGNAPLSISDSRLQTLDDSLFGELVVIGSGNASIDLNASTSITNLRIDGTVRLNAAAGGLTVGDRLVFGQRGASFLTESSGDLTLETHAMIIRRGSGSLSHAPSTGPSLHLAYQLGNGSLTGLDTGFSGGNLTAGLELPSSGLVTSLLAATGSRSGTNNSIRITSNLTISERLVLVSGNTQFQGGSVTLRDNARILLHRRDPASPLSVSLSNSVVAEGAYDLDIVHGGPRMDIPGTLQDGLGRLRSLTISALASSPPTDVLRLLGSFIAGHVVIGTEGLPVEMNLTGNTLSARESLTLTAGTVTSSQLALMLSEGVMNIGPEGRISGNIEVRSVGNLLAEGQVSGLEMAFEANAAISGAISSQTQLRALGQNQTLTFAEASTVGTLTLEQTSPDSRLDVMVEQGTPLLEISSQLNLSGGILSFPGGFIILPESASIERSPLPGIPSHIEGSIRRPTPEGSTSDVLFPIGMGGVYMPLTLSFTSPLLSGTDISVSLNRPDVVSLEGFPIVDQEAIIESVADPVWRVESSVDFARSQTYSISAGVPLATVGNAGGIRLLRQREGSADQSWVRVPGTQLTAVTEGGITARVFGSTGGLEPGGIWLALGLSEAPSSEPFEFQFVDVTTPASNRLLSIGSAPLIATGSGAPASRRAPFLASLEVPSQAPYVIESDGQPSIEGVLDVSSGGSALIAVHSTSTGSEMATALPVSIPGLPGQSRTGLVAVNLLDEGETVSLKNYWTDDSLIDDIESGATVSATAAAVRTAVAVDVSGSEVTEVFDVDLTALEGESASWLVHYGDAGVTLSIVRENGEVLHPAIVTGSEQRTDVIPTTAEWLGNYPNPFSSRTTLQIRLDGASDVRMQVFDLLGRKVRSQDIGRMGPGNQQIRLDGRGMAAGTYFVRLNIDSGRDQTVLTGQVLLSR